MSIDPSATALGPDEESASPAAVAPRSDLADLAAAIERLEALIAADAAPGPDRSAAVERIADIAFVLHEREVEASLCDALDAAVREISDSGLLKSAGTQRTREVAQLLRELSRRVNELMARKQAEEGADLSAAARAPRGAAKSVATRLNDADMATADIATDEEIAEDLFATDLPEDDEFARVVATLAGSLPASTDQEPASDPPPEAAAMAAESSDPPQFPDPPAQGAADGSPAASGEDVVVSVAAAEMTLVVGSADGAALDDFSDELSAPASVAAAEPSVEQAPADSTSVEVATPEATLNEIASNETALRETSPSQAPPTECLASTELAAESTAAALNEDQTSVARIAPPVSDVIAPPDVGESFSPAPGQASADVPVEPALLAAAQADEGSVEPPAEHDAAPRDDESPAEFCPPRKPDQQSAVEVADRPAAVVDKADEILAPVEPGPIEPKPVEAEPSRTVLPDVQAAIDPDEDPGDLFEPIVRTSAAPLPVSGEAATPVAAPPAPISVAADVAKTSPPASDSEQKFVPAAQAAPGALAIPAIAPTPVVTPDAKPQAQPAPSRAAAIAPTPAPRAAPADPLAPVRALSEEEMIALFS